MSVNQERVHVVTAEAIEIRPALAQAVVKAYRKAAQFITDLTTDDSALKAWAKSERVTWYPGMRHDSARHTWHEGFRGW